MLKYSELRGQMAALEEKYFQDFTLQNKSLLSKIAGVTYADGTSSEDDDFTLHLNLDKWLVIYETGKYKFPRETILGECNPRTKTIVIKPGLSKFEQRNVILHEIIHAYEHLLGKRLSQFFVLFLYDKLLKKLGHAKLWRKIYLDGHIYAKVDQHPPLFLLKSLELDLATKQPLGTIFAYGRKEYFEES
jgi:hypothetical protein